MFCVGLSVGLSNLFCGLALVIEFEIKILTFNWIIKRTQFLERKNKSLEARWDLRGSFWQWLRFG